MNFSPHLLDRSNGGSIADERAACAGQWALFDKTDETSHRHARNICGACDVITACRRNLRDELKRQDGGRPIGTWAGVLFNAGPGGTESRVRRDVA